MNSGEGQMDGSSPWRSLFPKQLELWRNAYSERAAGAQNGGSSTPMLSYADRVRKAGFPKPEVFALCQKWSAMHFLSGPLVLV